MSATGVSPNTHDNQQDKPTPKRRLSFITDYRFILLVNFGEISVARIKVNALCIYVSFSVLLHRQIVLNETSFLALRTQGKGVVKCIKVNLKKENVFEYALESTACRYLTAQSTVSGSVPQRVMAASLRPMSLSECPQW